MKAEDFAAKVAEIMGSLTAQQWVDLKKLYEEVTQYDYTKTITTLERLPDCELPPQNDARLWAEEYLRRHIEWSMRTFGPGTRTLGLTKHIRKETNEILENPHDLEEWIDIIILAIDGAWRCGRNRDYTPEEICDMLDAKQEKNFQRTWVLPADPAQPCEHDRTQGEPDGKDQA